MGTDSPRDLYFKTISYPEEKHYIRGFGNAHGISFGVGGEGKIVLITITNDFLVTYFVFAVLIGYYTNFRQFERDQGIRSR